MMKRCLIVFLFIALLCTCMAACAEPLTGKTAMEIVDDMGIGYNIGNSFDATGGYSSSNIYKQEQSWGNPIIDQALLERIRDAGFKTVRIPITWYRSLSKDGTYTIDPAFLARVKEVVDYAYNCDLYVIINMHHENWLNVKNLDTNYVKIGEQLAAIWAQVAEAFADYDQHLIFEGMNEPRMAGTSVEWNGSKAGYAAVNYLNQVFVDTVRLDPKGNNAERCLMIPSYAASSSYNVMAALELPTVNGEVAKNLIISEHCYAPYDFCLSDNWKTFDADNGSHTAGIESAFSNAYYLFLSRGIPVVIGETSATNTGNNIEERAEWAYYMGSRAASYGVPIIVWDNGHDGTSGGECHAWLRRKVNEKIASQSTPVPYPEVLDSLMAGAASVAWGSGCPENVADKSTVGGTAIWYNENGLKATAQWDKNYIQVLSDDAWYTPDTEFAVVYSGFGSPRIVLDSLDVEGASFMTVNPARTDTLENKQKIAWFTYDAIIAACEKAGVTDVKQIQNFCVISYSGNITTYEVSYVTK